MDQDKVIGVLLIIGKVLRLSVLDLDQHQGIEVLLTTGKVPRLAVLDLDQHKVTHTHTHTGGWSPIWQLILLYYYTTRSSNHTVIFMTGLYQLVWCCYGVTALRLCVL